MVKYQGPHTIALGTDVPKPLQVSLPTMRVGERAIITCAPKYSTGQFGCTDPDASLVIFVHMVSIVPRCIVCFSPTALSSQFL